MSPDRITAPTIEAVKFALHPLQRKVVFSDTTSNLPAYLCFYFFRQAFCIFLRHALLRRHPWRSNAQPFTEKSKPDNVPKTTLSPSSIKTPTRL